MMEPQDHPNDFQYPGGPPKPPYDITGYTLAFQMGVQFDRVLDDFNGPFQRIDGLLNPPAGKVSHSQDAAGFLLSHRVNDAFTGTMKLLESGEQVYWLKKELTANNKTYPVGTIYIPAKPTTQKLLDQLAGKLGLTFDSVTTAPHGDAIELRPVRVGLWDRYGGSQDSGQIRWMLEQAFPIKYERVYAPALNAGDLHSKYDVLIFSSDAIPAGAGGRGGRGGRGGGATVAGAGASGAPAQTAQGGRGGTAGGRGGRGAGPADIPAEYRDQIGNLSLATTGPQLRKFVEDGGTLLAIGNSANVGFYFGLPITDALTETVDGTTRRLPTTKFYVPGSLLQASVDNTLPIAWGLPDKVDVFYQNNPAYHVAPDAASKGVRVIASFADAEPLRSGWAWGQQYLNGTVSAVQADLGKGKLYLFAPEITFRAQSHGTFKFLFNAIELANAKEAAL
jgi:hypothetical protein